MRTEKITASNEILDALSSGRLQYAAQQAQVLIERWPEDADLQLLAGLVAKQTGELQNAQVFIAQAISLRPGFANAHHNQGVIYALQNKHAVAKTSFLRAVELDPGNADSQLGLAQSIKATGDLNETESSLRTAMDKFPDDPRFVVQLAEILRQAGRPDQTIELLEEKETSLPANAMIHNQFGIALKQLGNLEDSIAHYRKAISLVSDYAPAWNNLGLVLLTANDTRDAILALEKAIQLSPGWLEAHCNLATAYNQAGDKVKAVAAARHALTLDNHSAMAHFNLAAIQSQNFTVSDLQEADSAATRAIQLLPGFAEAYNCKALVLFKLGQLPAAEYAATQAIKHAPENPVFHVTHSELLVAQEKYSEAEQTLIDGLQVDERHGESHRQLGILRLKQGSADLALPEIERALELDSTDQRGIAHQTIALQLLARHGEAHRILGFENLIRENWLTCPAGYDSVTAFNQALALEIQNHPTLQFEPVGLAAVGGSLAQDILSPRGPATSAFEKFLRQSIANLQDSIDEDPAHPFLKCIPRKFDLNLWATLLVSEGEIASHIHEGSWISGAYFVKLPPEVKDQPDDQAGYLEFGQPNFDYHSDFETKCYQPIEGLLLLFPSYIYHRTIPFQSEFTRISISFDLVPRPG